MKGRSTAVHPQVQIKTASQRWVGNWFVLLCWKIEMFAVIPQHGRFGLMDKIQKTKNFIRIEEERVYIRVYLQLALVGLFAGFSYYVSKKTGNDWFSRSGAVMCLMGAVVTFEIVKVYQRALVKLLKANISLTEELDHFLEPPKRYQQLCYISYLTGIVGTAIWGYGDKLL